jgi:hypothetical protein
MSQWQTPRACGSDLRGPPHAAKDGSEAYESDEENEDSGRFDDTPSVPGVRTCAWKCLVFDSCVRPTTLTGIIGYTSLLKT